MERRVRYSGFDPQRAKQARLPGSFPMAVNEFRYETAQQGYAAAGTSMAPVNDRMMFDPKAASGQGNAVAAQEYRRYLESVDRQRRFINRQEQMIAAQKDIKFDMSKGLFGEPVLDQPAAKGRKFRFVREGGPLQVGLGGHIGPSIQALGSGPALQVFDEETGQYRYTSGTNNRPQLSQAEQELDNLVKEAGAVGSKGFFFSKGRSTGSQFKRANAMTWGNRFLKPVEVAGDDELARATRKMFEGSHSPRGVSRISMSSAVLEAVDGRDAAELERHAQREVPKNINGYFPLYEIPEEAAAAGDGTWHTHEFFGRTFYMPNGVPFVHGDEKVNSPEDDGDDDDNDTAPENTGSDLGDKVLIGLMVAAAVGAVVAIAMRKKDD